MVKNGAKVIDEKAPIKKINAYVCGNLHITITEDRDQGTTPMFIDCPQCKPTSGTFPTETMAGSMMYRVNQSLIATHEWYRPNKKELQDLYRDTKMGEFKDRAEYLKQGGLLFRKKEVGNG
jgi:hypothetical protein